TGAQISFAFSGSVAPVGSGAWISVASTDLVGNDGKPDLLLGGYSQSPIKSASQLLRNLSAGRSIAFRVEQTSTPNSPFPPDPLAPCVDVDGDGQSDAVFSSGQTTNNPPGYSGPVVSVFLKSDNFTQERIVPLYTPPGTPNLPQYITQLWIADASGDGKPDLL